MFNDTDDGQTQYCPMCLEWAEKYERLKAENEELKIKHQRYRECSIQFNQKLKQILEEVREIIDKACKECKNDEFSEGCIGSEFCALAEINEVLKDE